MKHTKSFLAAILVALSCPLAAATLVDTGSPGVLRVGKSFSDRQWLAGKFSTTSANITAVQGFIGSSQVGGSYSISLYEGSGNTPGSRLFGTTATYSGIEGFQGASGLNWTVPAGEYFAAFEVRAGDTFNGVMADRGTPNPLANYAFRDENQIWRPDLNLNIGIRVFGDIAAPPPPPPPPPVGLDFSKSVSIEVFDAAMTATFIPNNGRSLSDTATDLGFTHFNWVQTVNRYDSPLLAPNGVPLNFQLPIFDPPPGGYLGHWADQLPFYWDEDSNAGSGYHIDDNTFGSILQFQDTPSMTYTFPGGVMEFTTSLVGVESNGNWKPLHTWEWSSDRVCLTLPLVGELYCGGGPTQLRSIVDPGPGIGGILSVNTLANPWSVNRGVRDLWIANGAIAVPEPANWATLIAGFGIVGAALRRRRSQEGIQSGA